MAGDRTYHGYLVGYVYPRIRKGLFGLGKPKTLTWVEIYLTEEKQLVKNYFKIYFDKDYDRLHYEIKKLDKFAEAEAQD
jgi:hypothetical protein